MRLLLLFALFLLLAILLLALGLYGVGQPLYGVYADIFQHGQLYEGETRNLLYFRFICRVLLPAALLCSAAMTWGVARCFRSPGGE